MVRLGPEVAPERRASATSRACVSEAGSSLGVLAPAYAEVRGFPRRQAGEDFYLLDKLAKTVNAGRERLSIGVARVRDSAPEPEIAGRGFFDQLCS